MRFLDAEGIEHLETFTDATNVGNRQVELLHTLAMQGWERTGEWKL